MSIARGKIRAIKEQVLLLLVEQGRGKASNDVWTYKKETRGPHRPHVSVLHSLFHSGDRWSPLQRVSRTRVGRKQPRFVKPGSLGP